MSLEVSKSSGLHVCANISKWTNTLKICMSRNNMLYKEWKGVFRIHVTFENEKSRVLHKTILKTRIDTSLNWMSFLHLLHTFIKNLCIEFNWSMEYWNILTFSQREMYTILNFTAHYIDSLQTNEPGLDVKGLFQQFEQRKSLALKHNIHKITRRRKWPTTVALRMCVVNNKHYRPHLVRSKKNLTISLIRCGLKKLEH